MEDNSPIKQALRRWLEALHAFTNCLDLDEEQSHTLFETFDLFESYMVLKYGLSHNTGNMSFTVAKEMPHTGGSHPENDQQGAGNDEETSKNMFQKESGLQTGALDTTCTVGKWKGQALREMVKSPDGEKAVRVIAMSQLPLAKAAKIVVDYLDGVVEE